MAERTSRRERDFRCSLCPSNLSTKSSLRRHIRQHIKETTFNCNHCNYATVDGSVLARHVKAVHEKLTPFKCSFPGCDYSAATNDSLRKHNRKHNDNPLSRRPFPCDFAGCDYRATQRSTLTTHSRRQHSLNRTKDFCCSLCPAKFYEKGPLEYHINAVHVKERMYGCSKCRYKSSRKGDLSKHVRARHSEDGRAAGLKGGHPMKSSGPNMNAAGQECELIPAAVAWK